MPEADLTLTVHPAQEDHPSFPNSGEVQQTARSVLDQDALGPDRDERLLQRAHQGQGRGRRTTSPIAYQDLGLGPTGRRQCLEAVVGEHHLVHRRADAGENLAGVFGCEQDREVGGHGLGPE